MPLISLGPATGTDDGYWLLSGAIYNNNAPSYSFFNGYGYWWRTPNVPIPAGSTINSASLSIYLTSFTGSDHTQDWWGSDVDNASYPISAAAANALALTTATIRQVIPVAGIPKFHIVTGLGPIIQEIIDRVGWVQNSALMLLSKYFGGTGAIPLRPYEAGSSIWSLDIDYTPPASGNPWNYYAQAG
jgi:hypothetical protein